MHMLNQFVGLHHSLPKKKFVACRHVYIMESIRYNVSMSFLCALPVPDYRAVHDTLVRIHLQRCAEGQKPDVLWYLVGAVSANCYFCTCDIYIYAHKLHFIWNLFYIRLCEPFTYVGLAVSPEFEPPLQVCVAVTWSTVMLLIMSDLITWLFGSCW